MKFGKLKEGRFAVGAGKPIHWVKQRYIAIKSANDPNYIASLGQLSETERKALLFGDWNTFEEKKFDAKTKDIEKEAIKVKLLTEIKRALQEQGEQNIYTNMWAIEPIMDKFFEDHLIQSKAKIWD